MKEIKRILWIGLLLPSMLYAQGTGSKNVSITLLPVQLLDVEPAGSMSLAFTAPTEAGMAVNPIPNNTKWLQYTSAIAPGGINRRVTVSITQTIPGIDIKLQVAAASGLGGGVRGIPVTGEITLSTLAQNIVTGIGGAFTGTGANNGHQLTYTIRTNNYSNLVAANNTVIVVTYTIAE